MLNPRSNLCVQYVSLCQIEQTVANKHSVLVFRFLLALPGAPPSRAGIFHDHVCRLSLHIFTFHAVNVRPQLEAVSAS